MSRTPVADAPSTTPPPTERVSRSVNSDSTNVRSGDRGDTTHLTSATSEILQERRRQDGVRGTSDNAVPIVDANGRMTFNKPENETAKDYLKACMVWLNEHFKAGQPGPAGAERPQPGREAVPVASRAVVGEGLQPAGTERQPAHAIRDAAAAMARRDNGAGRERIDPRSYAGDRALLDKGPPEGADKIPQRETGRTRNNDNPNYAEQRKELLKNYGITDSNGNQIPENQLTKDQLKARHEILAVEQRMGPNGKPPLSEGEAARMFRDLNHLLTRTEGELSSTMGPDGTRRAQARDRATEFLSHVTHCEGSNTKIFQDAGTCGIMGTYGDLCRAAPSNASEILVAAMEAKNGKARLSNGTTFHVDSSFMGDTSHMALGSLANIELNPLNQYYTVGTATGQGDSGHRIHKGSFAGPEMVDPHTGRAYDSPNTTPKNLERLDKLVDAGTVRVWDSSIVAPDARAKGGPGSSMIDVAGMDAEHRKAEYVRAAKLGGGTAQMLGDANLFLGLRSGGDAYHNTGYSIRNGEVIVTDTNKGFSNDHANLGIIDAGVTMHRNRESDQNIIDQQRLHPERNRPRPDGGMNGLDSDAADKRRKDPEFAKKDENDDSTSRLRKQQQAQAEMQREQQRAMAQQQLNSIRLRQVAYQLKNPGKDLPAELETPGNLLALASTSTA